MSLSSQYLEELSRRYKKQVEELQLSFTKALANIEEQNRENDVRKQELLEQNVQLRSDLETLTERIFSWRNIVACCASFTCIQLLIFYGILRVWGYPHGSMARSSSTDIQAMLANMDTTPRKRRTGNVEIRYRRKSAEEKRERTVSESSQQQRRPSTEALNIMGTYEELLIHDDSAEATDECSQISNGYDDRRWPKTNSTGDAMVRIEEINDRADYEFYGPSVELQSIKTNGDDDCASVTTLESSMDTSSPLNKKSSKSSLKQRNKMRRISSPAFLRSTFANGSGNGGGSTGKASGWEWYARRSLQSSQTNSKQKAKSESPMSAPQQNGSATRQKDRLNSSAASSIGSTTDLERKPSGNLKRLLKKIF